MRPLWVQEAWILGLLEEADLRSLWEEGPSIRSFPVLQPDQARWDVAGEGREDAKLGRSPGLNLGPCCFFGASNGFVRESAVMELDLLLGESRGYWNYHAPTKWFGQAKASEKINNDRANLLFDTGAEISILDIAFARKIGCQIDESERQECVGSGGVRVYHGKTYPHQGHPERELGIHF
ncbi:unnamed protein product [Peronospora belbahrii]|uniref:Peptidase A2 domain-containing protein n=1 Tax=Peronospora belbahrii TaxID=622444 RepID=A0AAU9L4T1_9STRA|nr:unnamed protein product [Peronospora belbahrii]CAH0480934.1 unnamed protein product [Peronospora belbahrii]